MEKINNYVEEKEINENEILEVLKSIVYSSIGIFIFFIPIKINGQTTTFLYHISYKIQNDIGPLLKLMIIVFVGLYCIKGIMNKNENNIISVTRLLSIFVLLNIFYGNKELIFIEDDTIFVLEEIILNVATVLPITSIFMIFLLEYGLLDIVESYFQKFMKNTYKMSGKTVINILIFLFTNSICGYFVTNYMYKKGKLRENETVILITSFSITSIWMFDYFCNELSIRKLELAIISIVVLSIVNIITCRVYPFNKKKKSYYIKTTYKETLHKNDKFKKGIKKYIKNNHKKYIFKEIVNNLEECFQLITRLIPRLIIVIIVSDIIFRNELTIELLSQITTYILNLFKFEEISELTQFLSLNMYNNIIAIDSVANILNYQNKLIVAMIAMISCISISTNITYIKYTEINITTKEWIIIFFQRLILILAIYSLIRYAIVGYLI